MGNNSISKLKFIETIREKEKISSRTQVAKESGVATKTIKAILDGTVEKELGKDKALISHNKRVSLIGALSRLALFCHDSPEKWLEEIGVEIDKSVRKTIEASRKRAYRHSPSKNVIDRIMAKNTVDVGILKYGTFGRDLPEFGKTFYHAYGERVIGTIFPKLTPQFHCQSNPHLIIEKLCKGEYDIVIGMSDMVERQVKGMQFIPIPGLKISLSAILGKSGLIEDPEKKKISNWWEQILDPLNYSKYLAVVIEDESADVYLQGCCANDNVKRISSVDAKKAARDFVRLLKNSSPDIELFLIADEETIGGIAEVLPKEGLQRESFLQMEKHVTFEDKSPSHQVSLAIQDNAMRWYDLVKRATLELFTTAHKQLALLYSSLIVKSQFNQRGHHLRLVDFNIDGNDCVEFKSTLFDDLEAKLKSNTELKVESILPPNWGQMVEEKSLNKRISDIEIELKEIKELLKSLTR